MGYRFRTIRYLFLALTHSSFAPTHKDSNERLEFLGDAVLGLVIANLLYEHFPDAPEGELSTMRGVIVSRKACCQVARDLEIDRYLLTGNGTVRIPDSMIANLMEAIIGAVFLDSGFEEAKQFVEKNFAEKMNEFIESEDLENHKAALQEAVHHLKWGNPIVYELLEEKGPQHLRCFKVAVKIGHQCFHSAWGRNKKEAEQHAAWNALLELEGKEPCWQDGDE